MKCARCGGESRILEVADIIADRTYSVRRHRECLRCNYQFHTSEIEYRGPHRATLTIQQVADIRKMKAKNPKMPQRTLAEQFGVTQSTISRVLNKVRWPAFNGRDQI